MAITFAVAGRKGGCGKSTLAASLAAVSASRAFQTGTVDLDSQSNLSRWCLGRDKIAALGAIESVVALQWPSPDLLRLDVPVLQSVTDRKSLVEAVGPTCIHAVEHVPGLSVVPCANHLHPETAKDVVVSLLPFDAIFVDCPPDISGYAVRAILGQADMVISPIICEPWSVDSIEALVREIRSVGRGDLLENDRVLFVVNQRAKTAMQDRLEKDVRKVYGRWVAKTVLPRAVAIAEASLDPRILTKKHPLWKAGLSLWKEIESVAKRKPVVAA